LFPRARGFLHLFEIWTSCVCEDCGATADALPYWMLLRGIAYLASGVSSALCAGQRDGMARLPQIPASIPVVFRARISYIDSLFHWLVDCLLLSLCFGSLYHTRGFFGGCFSATRCKM